MFFRGREIAHPEIGRRILERLIQEVSELAVSENMPRLEGNTMHTILGPRPQAAQQRRPATAEPRAAVPDGAPVQPVVARQAPRREAPKEAQESPDSLTPAPPAPVGEET